MSALSIIISREYLERVKRKSFIISTILMPIFMVGMMMAPALITIFSGPEEKVIAVIDDTAVIAPTLQNGDEIRFRNITDGLDGLCTSVTILVATFMTIIALGEGSGISPITEAVVGSLLGFLLFNVYPARVFMGDTGSLALGGFVAATASMMNLQLFILIFGLIYLVEVLSVILQVVYFKHTGGKRLFKMAPIHHHFELSGWPETKVVAVFSIITAVLCLIGFLAL